MAKSIEAESIHALLRELSLEELRRVRVVLNNIIKVRGQQLGLHLRVGDTVSWQQRAGYRMSGTITKINRTTVTVDTPSQGSWKVAMSLLRKIS